MHRDDQRVLDLRGVHNFRDFGGYALAGGGRVRRGLLWRSGQHAEATEADLAAIDGLGLVAVYDLRSRHEREHYPCVRPAGFSAQVVTTEDPDVAAQIGHAPDTELAPHVAAVLAATRSLTQATDAASARERMVNSYRAFPHRRALVAMVRRYLGDLARLEGASLVNCMAGKDRTGIAVALAQWAIGVHRDDIVADYLLTNTAGDPAARIEAGERTIAAVSGALNPDALAVVMAVDASWLEAAFDAMAKEEGSVDAYLERALGVDAGVRRALRDRLVEV